MENKWELKLHDDVEDPYYELTNGQTTLCATCGFVGETEDEEDAIFKKVVDTLNQSGIDWHSENALELKQHIEIQEWKSKYDELKAENERLAEELRESRNSVKSLRYSVDQYYKLITEHTDLKAEGQRLVDTLQDLVESIPNQTEDADWWPDSLRTAIENANKYIHDWQNKEGVPHKDLGACKNCNNRAATKDYNGHQYYVCDHCYERLSSEFDEEYR